MNRKQRRAAGIPGGYLIGAPDVLAALDFHCPDCNSDIERWIDSHGIHRVAIRHDDTCPWLAAHGK